MNLAEFDFERLRWVRWLDLSTFAYWIGVLSDFPPNFTCDAKHASTVMSYQYDVEEQADGVEDLTMFRDLGLRDFTPIAPVTLALRWSPFPTAELALGPAAFADHDDQYSGTLAVFRPVESPMFLAMTRDERHFHFLLNHACQHALRSQGWVLLAGSPGWSYEYGDWGENGPHLQQLMADFGFVYCARRPTDA